jgi:hypothetical protein
MMEIRANEAFVWVDEEQCPKELAVIEICDYGDNFFDLHFLNTKTDCMIGNHSICGIPGKKRLMEIVEDLQKKAEGIQYKFTDTSDWDEY